VGALSVSTVGDTIAPVALAFAVLDLTNSPSDLGLVLGVQSLVIVMSLSVGGVVADRMDRRIVMIAANVVGAAAQMALALLLLSGGAGLPAIVALCALKGAATGFFVPASLGVIPQAVGGSDVQAAYGLQRTVMAVAQIAGPALGGLIVATAGPSLAILIDAATFLASSALLLRVEGLGTSDPALRLGFIREFQEGWRYVRSRTWLWVAILNAGLVQLVLVSSLDVLGPAVARESLGGAAAWGLIVASFSVGGIAGGILSVRVRPERPLRAVYLILLMAGGPSLALLALPAPLPLIAATEFFSGLAITLFEVIETSLIAEKIPSHAQSRVYAFDNMGALALRPLGLIAVGPIAAAVGAGTTLGIASVVMVFLILWPLSYTSVRTLRWESPAPVTE
jgi:MFS family permease